MQISSLRYKDRCFPSEEEDGSKSNQQTNSEWLVSFCLSWDLTAHHRCAKITRSTLKRNEVYSVHRENYTVAL